MSKIAQSLTDLIGHTPLLQINKLTTANGCKAKILAKLEYFNPAGSTKDRAAFSMIMEAEKSGAIKQGATIIEPTSGNTGVGLAMVAAVRDYKLILTMPDNMSTERRNLLQARGAEIVLTPSSQGMAGAIAKAEELHTQIPNSLILQQFSNPANPLAHEKTTAIEILEDTDGQIDFFVASVGTGGTLSGTARGLKAKLPHLKAIAVEPASSPLLSGGKAGPHKIQGIGANFIPENYQKELTDEVITITDDAAMETARQLSLQEGLLVGISSGAAMAAAIKLAQRAENQDKTIVVLLPDTGERYLSTELFAPLIHC